MATKLGEAKIQEMFLEYCRKPTVKHVADMCHTSRGVVRKYRDERDWDAPLLAIRSDVKGRIDKGVADIIAESLEIIQLFKQKLWGRIKRNRSSSQSTASDLDRIVRLELLLLGRPDSRPEVIAGKELRELPTEQLMKMLGELEGE
jgi:hypothetical protein